MPTTALSSKKVSYAAECDYRFRDLIKHIGNLERRRPKSAFYGLTHSIIGGTGSLMRSASPSSMR